MGQLQTPSLEQVTLVCFSGHICKECVSFPRQLKGEAWGSVEQGSRTGALSGENPGILGRKTTLIRGIESRHLLCVWLHFI